MAHRVVAEALGVHTSPLRNEQKHRHCTSQRKHCACIPPPYAYSSSIKTARKIVLEALCMHTFSLHTVKSVDTARKVVVETSSVRTFTIRSLQKHRHCTQSRSGSIVTAYFNLKQCAKGSTLHAKSYWKHCACILRTYSQCKSGHAAKTVAEALSLHTSSLHKTAVEILHLQTPFLHTAQKPRP